MSEVGRQRHSVFVIAQSFGLGDEVEQKGAKRPLNVRHTDPRAPDVYPRTTVIFRLVLKIVANPVTSYSLFIQFLYDYGRKLQRDTKLLKSAVHIAWIIKQNVY